jgi:hypothetical protein
MRKQFAWFTYSIKDCNNVRSKKKKKIVTKMMKMIRVVMRRLLCDQLEEMGIAQQVDVW